MAGFSYTPPGKVAKTFMKSDKFFRGLRGPVGAGKSVCCAIEMYRRALSQAPDESGWRKTRWAVIRNTGPELKTTTIKTWLDWFKESDFGKFNWSPPFTHRIKQQLSDGTQLDMEVIFLALDSEMDVKKLLSLELTGAWINEAREIAKANVDGVTMRVGRFPSMKDGGPSWYGVIADTNAPDEDHWWPVMAGEVPIPEHLTREEALMLQKPKDWEFFTQPPGMIELIDGNGQVQAYEINPHGENVANLTPDYYPKIIQGKTRRWIEVYVLNKLGALNAGKPVYPTFKRDIHVAKQPLEALPMTHIMVGIDYGLTPAAVFLQMTPLGQVRILRELVTTDMGATRFGPLLKSYAAREFPDHIEKYMRFTGDPAGDGRAQTDEQTPAKILRTFGILVRPATTNDPIIRIEAVAQALDRLIDGEPGLLIDPGCRTIIRGFEAGYSYRKLKVGGTEARYDETPEKNKFSHPHDALQYGALGLGLGKQLMGASQTETVRQQGGTFNPFRSNRMRQERGGWGSIKTL